VTDSARVFHGFNPVEHQVHEDLLQLHAGSNAETTTRRNAQIIEYRQSSSSKIPLRMEFNPRIHALCATHRRINEFRGLTSARCRGTGPKSVHEHGTCLLNY
jgi:hypothetical protein